MEIHFVLKHFINFDDTFLYTSMQVLSMQEGERERDWRRKLSCKKTALINHYHDAYTVSNLEFLQKTKVDDNSHNQSHLTVYSTKYSLATLQLCYPVK